MSDTVNGTIKALDGADAFADYFRRNYPRDTIISSPDWHAPRIYRAAVYAYRSATPANATDTAGLDAMMSAGLLDTVRRTAMHLYGETQDYPCDDVKRMGSTIAALQAENDRLQAELARMRDRLTSPEFLRPLIQEQSAGEWDDKTIDADVETFAAALRAALTDSQKETGE